MRIKTGIVLTVIIFVSILSLIGAAFYESRITKPNPFQAYYDSFPAGGGFQNCIESGLGSAFKSAYSEGVVSALLIETSGKCSSSNISVSNWYYDLPPLVQNCYKFAYGDSLTKILEDPTYQPIQARASSPLITLQSCQPLQDFAIKQKTFYSYLKAPELAGASYFEVLPEDNSASTTSVGLDSRYLELATTTPGFDQNSIGLQIVFDAQGEKILDETIAKYSGDRIALYVDGQYVAVTGDTGLDTSIKTGTGVLEFKDLSMSVLKVEGLVKNINAGKGLTQSQSVPDSQQLSL